MATAWLARIDAHDSGGGDVAVRLATHNDPSVTALDGATWWPVIVQLPVLRHDFMDGAISGEVGVPSGNLSFRDTLNIAGAPQNWLSLRWAGARVRLWSGTVGAAFASYTLRVDATVPAQPVADGGVIAIDVRPDDRWLDKPLLAIYGGTGGADGPDAMAGQVKPLCLGAPRFAPATLVDPDNLVWQLSNGQIQGVETAFDRLARFGASSGDYATYAALIAASISEGAWATCLAAGLVRHGAPHDGTPGWHVQGDKGGAGGWVRKPGAILSRIAELAGVTAHAASMAALDSARPWNMSFVLREQLTPRQLVQQIAADVCAACGVDWLGQFWARPLGIGSASQTLRADGTSLPASGPVRRIAIAAPWWRLATRAEVTHAPVAPADAAYDYVYRGAYKSARVYRADDVVTMDDGSMWRFVGATPLAGSTPATGNANWSQELTAVTDAVPAPTQVASSPPSDLPTGGIWFRNSDMRPFRQRGGALMIGADHVLFGGGNILLSNWDAVQDVGIPTAQAAADSALAALTDIASDNILSPVEKPQVILERDVITAEQSGIETVATTFGITTEKTAYSNAISALTTYLATLTSPVAWNVLTGNTTIVGTTFRSKFSDVYAARQTLLNKINDAGQAGSARVDGPPLRAFTASYLGAIEPSAQLPANIAFQRWRGATNVTSTATWSIASQGTITGGTVTISGGVVTIPSGVTIPRDTDIIVRSVIDGLTIDTILKVTRTDAAAPAGGGGSGGGTEKQINVFGNVSGTSWTDLFSEQTVKTGSGCALALVISHSITTAAASPDGTFGIEYRWRYRPTAGSFTDGSTLSADASPVVEAESGFYYVTDGSMVDTVNVSGLTASADHGVILQARRTAASPTKTISFSGTATMTGS